MAIQKKTLELIEQAYNILNEYNPMTLRQVYYQLVSKHAIDNKMSEYKRLSNALVRARQEGTIPWEWIEDRGRQPRGVSMWQGLPDFIETVKNAYRKDIWDSQPTYIEVWLEKDALSGIFADIVNQYGVTLCVGKGYNSWSVYKEASDRFEVKDKPAKILYFGDFDPSGEDMVRAIRDSLKFLGMTDESRELYSGFGMSKELREIASFSGTCPEIEKISLTPEDITEYNLPPDFTKKTDSRAKNFIKQHGDIAVELDALPLPVLQQKIKDSIEENIDIEAWGEIKKIESQERKELVNLFNK